MQVCIVKKRDTKEMYALKHMNKVQMIHKHAVDNVFREMILLQGLEHPYLDNLWFTFHDREDIFMVLDLMLGKGWLVNWMRRGGGGRFGELFSLLKVLIIQQHNKGVVRDVSISVVPRFPLIR